MTNGISHKQVTWFTLGLSKLAQVYHECKFSCTEPSVLLSRMEVWHGVGIWSVCTMTGMFRCWTSKLSGSLLYWPPASYPLTVVGSSSISSNCIGREDTLALLSGDLVAFWVHIGPRTAALGREGGGGVPVFFSRKKHSQNTVILGLSWAQKNSSPESPAMLVLLLVMGKWQERWRHW